MIRIAPDLFGLFFAGILFFLRPSLGASEPVEFLSAWLFLGFIFLAGFYCLEHLDRPPSLIILLAVTVVTRLILIGQGPTLDNDIYRYMSDGIMICQRVNPYQISPLDPITQSFQTPWWHLVGYSELTTIYPPLTQGLLALGSYLSSGSILTMKLMALIGDGLVLAAILVMLKLLRRPLGWAFVYAWNPLVLKEISDSGHMDAWPALFLTLGCLFALKNFSFSSGTALGIAVGFKLTPIIAFIPLILYIKNRMRFLSGFGLSAIISLLPLLMFGNLGGSGLDLFSRTWRFNDSVHRLLLFFLSDLSLSRFMAALLFSGIMIILFVRWNKEPRPSPKIFSGRIVMLFFLALFLSPVANPWYLIWALPLASVCFPKYYLLWASTVFLSYSFYIESRAIPTLLWIQYLPVILLFVFSIIRKRSTLFAGKTNRFS